MRKIIVLIIILMLFPYKTCAKHLYKESFYQKKWCAEHKGILEYKNEDKTRIDCLTKTHAVEFDFAQKWAEAAGQVLYYHLMTKRRGMVVLIMEDPRSEMKYYQRIKKLADEYDFDVDYMKIYP